MIFRFIKTFLVFIIINKILLIHPCKNCCYVNSSSQESKFTFLNKNNNFIKQNQIYYDGYNNYKIFTESGQPLKNGSESSQLSSLSYSNCFFAPCNLQDSRHRRSGKPAFHGLPRRSSGVHRFREPRAHDHEAEGRAHGTLL